MRDNIASFSVFDRKMPHKYEIIFIFFPNFQAMVSLFIPVYFLNIIAGLSQLVGMD